MHSLKTRGFCAGNKELPHIAGFGGFFVLLVAVLCLNTFGTSHQRRSSSLDKASRKKVNLLLVKPNKVNGDVLHTWY